MRLLLLEHVGGDAEYAVVKAAVAGTPQPGQAVRVQLLAALEQPAPEEVALDVLHHVLHLALALRVALAAEHRLEVLSGDEAAEHARQQQVAKVLVVQEHLVLVVKDLLRHAAEVLERQLMGIHSGRRIERACAEMDILVARAAKHKHEEIHLLPAAVAAVHPGLAEVCLAPLTEGQLGLLLIRTGRLLLTLGDAMLQTQVSNIVKHCLAADILQFFAVALLQAILYLTARIAGIATQKVDDETLIDVQLVTVLTLADAAGEKFILAHTQILADGAAINSQLARNLALV